MDSTKIYYSKRKGFLIAGQPETKNSGNFDTFRSLSAEGVAFTKNNVDQNTNLTDFIFEKQSPCRLASPTFSPLLIPHQHSHLTLTHCESPPIHTLNLSDYSLVTQNSLQCQHTDLLLQMSEANGNNLNLQDTLLSVSNFERCLEIPNVLFNSVNSGTYCPPSPIEYQQFIVSTWPQINSYVNMNICFANIYNLVLSTGLPNYLAAKQPLTSGLKINNWKLALLGYHDQQLLEFLEFGWPADYTAPKLPKPTLFNHKELLDYSKFITDYITEESKHGALLGPFTVLPFVPWAQFSPIMTREKKNSIN